MNPKFETQSPQRRADLPGERRALAMRNLRERLLLPAVGLVLLTGVLAAAWLISEDQRASKGARREISEDESRRLREEVDERERNFTTLVQRKARVTAEDLAELEAAVAAQERYIELAGSMPAETNRLEGLRTKLHVYKAEALREASVAAEKAAETAQESGNPAEAIARLKEALAPLHTPVLGNGDIWTAQDAMRMVAHTGCDGVVVGRGCLGRPWLFGQLAAGFHGEPIPGDPGLATVLATLRRHAQLLVDDYGELKGCRDIRKHMAWYLKGFSVRQQVRQSLGTVATLAELDELLSQIDADQEFNAEVGEGPRGRTSGNRRPSLPDGWLDSCDLDGEAAALVAAAEISVSGG